MSLEQGVTYYTKATADIGVNFPENKVACSWCRLFCRYEENFKRYSCRLTEEWLLNPFSEIGHNCPLIFKEEDNEI